MGLHHPLKVAGIEGGIDHAFGELSAGEGSKLVSGIGEAYFGKSIEGACQEGSTPLLQGPRFLSIIAGDK